MRITRRKETEERNFSRKKAKVVLSPSVFSRRERYASRQMRHNSRR